MQKKTKHVIISVISDLVTDQRVHRTALALHRKGLRVTLVGREKRDSLPLQKREYATHRFRLLWETGPLFYAEYNLRLFVYLLFHRAEVLVANDLDTLLANYLIAGLKGSALYYDSHEVFTEVPELVSRPPTQKIWKRIERWIFPNLKYIYTVNDSIAARYSNEYGKTVAVVRNMPFRNSGTGRKTRAELGLPADKKILLYQGAGINIHRGAEEALEAMQFLEGMVLLFIGSGDVIEVLKKEAASLNLGQKVFFIPKQPLEELQEYTRLSDAGLTLDKDTNINYRFSLPNKLFDYIQAELPVLASDLPEVSKIVKSYDIGLISTSHDPRHLAQCMRDLFSDASRLARWKENLKLAAEECCWEREENRLLEIFKDVL